MTIVRMMCIGLFSVSMSLYAMEEEQKQDHFATFEYLTIANGEYHKVTHTQKREDLWAFGAGERHVHTVQSGKEARDIFGTILFYTFEVSRGQHFNDDTVVRAIAQVDREVSEGTASVSPGATSVALVHSTDDITKAKLVRLGGIHVLHLNPTGAKKYGYHVFGEHAQEDERARSLGWSAERLKEAGLKHSRSIGDPERNKNAGLVLNTPEITQCELGAYGDFLFMPDVFFQKADVQEQMSIVLQHPHNPIEDVVTAINKVHAIACADKVGITHFTYTRMHNASEDTAAHS